MAGIKREAAAKAAWEKAANESKVADALVKPGRTPRPDWMSGPSRLPRKPPSQVRQ